MAHTSELAPPRTARQQPLDAQPGLRDRLRSVRETRRGQLAIKCSKFGGIALMTMGLVVPAYHAYESASAPDCTLRVTHAGVAISNLRANIYANYGVTDPGQVTLAPLAHPNEARDITGIRTGLILDQYSIVRMSDIPAKVCDEIGPLYGSSDHDSALDFWENPVPILQKFDPFH